MVWSMLLPHFDFEAPRSLGEACALLAGAQGEARLMAGGTDVLAKMKRGQLRPRLVVSLGRIEELVPIEATADGGLRLGALATMSRIAASPALGGPWVALAEGAAAVAGPLIRNRATVGGNILSARPCADTVPPLIALGARLLLARAGSNRTVDLDGFTTDPGTTAIAPGEVLVAVELPRPAGPTGSAYLKLSRRAAMDVTIVGCAAAVSFDKKCERLVRARVVLTSVAPISLRVGEAETILVGARPVEATLAAAAAAARRAARPIDDHRAPAAYRSEVVEVLARRALAGAVERARGGVQ